MLTLALEATQRILGNTEAALNRATLVDALIDDAPLCAAINRLLAVKRAVGEAESGEPLPILNAFIERELKRLESVAPPRATRIDAAVLDQLLLNTVLRTTAARMQSPLEREYA
jgi:predicted nucleotidyltransferase